MSPFRLLAALMYALSCSHSLTAEGSFQACKSPQYVELGKKATISCNFDENFYGVFWFNTTNITSQKRPFMIITVSEKSGRGYSSGEFDIKDNGSLIINKVSLQHDITFAVNVLYTIDGDPNVENVRVIVFVIPENPYPVIDACDGNGFCYQSTNTEFTINCSVRDSRPPPRLNLLLKTSEGEVSLPSNKTTLPEGILYTTIIQATIQFNETNRLLLISCHGSITPHVENETTILIENKQSEPLRVNERINAEIGSEVKLSCGDNTASHFVWRQKGQQSPIAVGLGSRYGNAINVYNKEFDFAGHNNSLIITFIEKEHNGTYICLHGDGSATTSKVIEVAVNDSGKNQWFLNLILVVILVVLLIISTIAIAACCLKKVLTDRKSRKRKGTHSKESKREVIPMLTKHITIAEIEKHVTTRDVVLKWDPSNKDDCKKQHERKIEWLIKASKEGITVRCVKPQNCLESVDDRGVRLASGNILPVIESLKILNIHQAKTTSLEVQDLEEILQYATQSSELTNLQFNGFCMPYLTTESGSVYEVIQNSELKVEWVSNTPEMGILSINNKECCWEDNTGKKVEQSSFDDMIKKMQERNDRTTNVNLQDIDDMFL